MLEPARPSDQEAVNALARQVHELHVGWRPDIFRMPEELFPEDRFSALLENNQMYVARKDGAVIAYALLIVRERKLPGLVDRKIMLLDEICIEETCRHQGIGKLLMEEIKKIARHLGCTDLQLGVYPQNEAAIALYESAGMKVRSIDYQMKL